MVVPANPSNYSFCSPEQNEIVRNTTKLSKKDFSTSVAMFALGTAFAVGTLVPINLKIPQPVNGFSSILPSLIAAPFIIGGIVEPICFKKNC